MDSNWNTPGNWSASRTPGTESGDRVLLSGRSAAPVVATLVEADHACSVQMSDGALLEVTRSGLRCDAVALGAVEGKGGGHLLLRGRGEAVMDIAGDLRVGASAATSDSLVHLRTGTLKVGGSLQVEKGSLRVFGSSPAVETKDLTISSAGTLRFDFNTKPVQAIRVSDKLVIEEGAKLEIDLSYYTTGGNQLELIEFSSVSGSFDPKNISITGLGGGVITMDEDSLNLTVIDDVAKRSSTLWFVATGGSGEEPQDLQVNTGRRIRDLSSPHLSYSTKADGDDMVHAVQWSGSDFNGDGANDTVSFDLRVEGFTGSNPTYDDDTESASMTRVGRPADVRGNKEGWGVGKDLDLDAGESLRFSIENLKLSTPGKEGEVGSFVGMQMTEVDGGKGHTLMVGEGEDLEAWTWSNSLSIGFKPELPLLVTSANSSKVGVNHVAFRLFVSELPDHMDSESHDYSVYPTGPQHLSDYPKVTKRLHPEFSWDTLPMTARVNSRKALPESYAKIMATTYPKLGLGGNSYYGSKFKDEGVIKMAAMLKSFNPDVLLTTYRNAGVHFTGFSADEKFNEEEWFEYVIDENGKRKYITYSGKQNAYNHDHPEMRKWWVDAAVALMDDPNIDGIFIDKANGGEEPIQDEKGEIVAPEGKVQSYLDLAARIPEDAFLTGNILRTNRPGGNRELLHVFNGTYLESWEKVNGDSLVTMTNADTICASLQLIREARVKGFDVFTNFRDLKWHRVEDEKIDKWIAKGREVEVREKMKQAFQYPLAFYLITAEPYSYFQYQTSTDADMPEFCWNSKAHFDEFRNPLGKPLGPPVKDGYIFTRSFEHVDVWLDVENKKSRLTWDWQPIAESQTVQVVQDVPKAVELKGSNPRDTKLEFKVFEPGQPAHGELSGTPPNLIYTPDPGFAGEDSFVFKTYNDMAESLSATVTVVVAPAEQ